MSLCILSTRMLTVFIVVNIIDGASLLFTGNQSLHFSETESKNTLQ